MSAVCKKCRRVGEKLFLKGERCSLPKCAMVKKSYPPGQHGNKGQGRLSEYGMQLMVKQRIKHVYGLREQHLRNYFEKVRNKGGNVGSALVRKLELRLDNVIFRSGLADSRRQARQMVGHGIFQIKGRKVDIPSYEVKVGEEIEIKESKAKGKLMTDKLKKLEKQENTCDWLYFDPQQQLVKVIDIPGEKQLKEVGNVSVIVEYYSR